jgi:hypothetical protein
MIDSIEPYRVNVALTQAELHASELRFWPQKPSTLFNYTPTSLLSQTIGSSIVRASFRASLFTGEPG